MKSKNEINREHYLKHSSEINAKRKAKREAKKEELESLRIAVNQNTQSQIMPAQTPQSDQTPQTPQSDQTRQTPQTPQSDGQPIESIISNGSIKIRKPNYKEFLNASIEKYNIRFGEDKLIKRWMRQTRSKAVLVEGGSGIGKTAFCKYIATKQSDPCIFFSCHSTIDE